MSYIGSYPPPHEGIRALFPPCASILVRLISHCIVVSVSKKLNSAYHCGIPDSGFKRNLRLCPTGNRILGVWISGRSLVYFTFFVVFDYSQLVWMLAETRLGNNCSLIIAKCERKGLLDGRDSKMSGSITANISFSLQESVNKMCFLIIIPVKRKDI